MKRLATFDDDDDVNNCKRRLIKFLSPSSHDGQSRSRGLTARYSGLQLSEGRRACVVVGKVKALARVIILARRINWDLESKIKLPSRAGTSVTIRRKEEKKKGVWIYYFVRRPAMQTLESWPYNAWRKGLSLPLGYWTDTWWILKFTKIVPWTHDRNTCL